MDDRMLLRPDEAALRLGISRGTIYQLIADGRIESLTIGKSRRIEVRALERFIEAQRQLQAAAV